MKKTKRAVAGKTVDVLIDTPRDSRNKYKFDKPRAVTAMPSTCSC